ncbi:MAG: hypothetical protein ABIW76_00750 [Fibrobacteria bacterium]
MRPTALLTIVGLLVAASACAAKPKSALPASGPAPGTPPKSDSAKAATGTTAPVSAQPDSGSASAKKPAASRPSASTDTAPRSGITDSAKSANAIRASTDSIAQAAGMTPVQDSSQYIKLYEYIANPILQLATFPVDLILVPAVKAVIFPSKAPLRYMVNENVIDRIIKLISYGENDVVMIYPTLNLAPGTGSYTGLTFRHQEIFGRPTERLVAYGYYYVNGDWKFRSYLAAKEILGTGFTSKVSIGLNRVKNSSLIQPGTAYSWGFSDSSNTFSANLGHLVFEKFALKGSYSFRDNNYGKAPPQKDSLVSDFFRNESGELDTEIRGLNSSWQDNSFAVGLGRDTRNNENIPLNGSNFNTVYHYHFTNAKHDYHGWEATLSNYFKLGKEKYEVYVPPGKKSSATGVRKVLERMDLENLKNELFTRKALVTHLYAAQTFELPGNHMPVYGLQTLGNDTPLRGYSGSRFRDYTVFSAGAEYRFPIIRLVDGMMFNEYGVYGRSWDKIDVLDNIKNSWGFGIRVRRPDIYLFRLQLGFHGAEGIQVNMSVDEPY